jgi:hypothetical protein
MNPSSLQFIYGPQWKLLFWTLVVGIVFLVLAGMRVISLGSGFGLALLPLAFVVTGTLRRLLCPRFLKLDQTRLSVCSGFFQCCVTKVAYEEIDHAWESATGSMSVLHLRTKARTFEIVSTLLPDMDSYVAARSFINSRLTPEAIDRGNQPQTQQEGKYCFKCSYEGNGEILAATGESLWRFETQHFSGRPRYPYGFLRLPDFVIYGKESKEAFRVKSERKWASAQFALLENGLQVCTIKQRSLLRNKYTLAFVNGEHWVFTMPLFTVAFRGVSDAGKEIHVRLGSHNIWWALIDPSADQPQLVAAIAFIHLESLRCNRDLKSFLYCFV